MKHRKIFKKVVNGSKILGKLGLTGANIASLQTDNRDNWAIAGQPYGPGNMAQIGIERNMIEPPKDIIFSELKTKIEEKLNRIEAANRGYKDYYKRFQRALRLSYYFYYQIKQIVNLQYAGKEVPQENLPNLKNIEVTLEADNMLYKSLDLKTLISRGFPGINGPNSTALVNPKEQFLDDITFDIITTMYNKENNNEVQIIKNPEDIPYYDPM